MLIDYEDTPASAVSRLRTLGVDDQAMRDRFAYVRPDGPLIDRQGRVAGHTMARLEALAADVVVIDSIGESLAAEGFKPNDDDQVTRWFRLLPRRLARNGSAVLGLDHRAKNKDDRGLWAIGSQRKLAAIDGAAYVADVKVAPTKTADGHVRLICAKDRHGTHQRDHMVADVHIRNLDGRRAPAPGGAGDDVPSHGADGAGQSVPRRDADELAARCPPRRHRQERNPHSGTELAAR